MSKKIGVLVALATICALSLFLLNCGSSSSHPTGILYVLTEGNNGVGNNVSSFATDLNNGNLTLINSNAATCNPAGSSCGPPLDILLDPAGANAFVLNQGIPSILPPTAPTIYSYPVNSDGSLGSPASNPTTLNAGDLPASIMMDSSGQFLFVATQGVFPSLTTCPPRSSSDSGYAGCPSIEVFAISGGSLTAAPGSPLYVSKIPTGVSPVVFTPSGSGTAQELLFVSNDLDICPTCNPPHNDNTVSEYVVNSDGSLAEQSNSPYAVAANNPVSVFAVNTNGNAGGLFVYVGKSDADGGAVYPFQVCTVVGNLGCDGQDVQSNLMSPLQQTCAEPPCNQVPPTVVGLDPVQMLVDPTLNFLYVLSEGANTVYESQINTASGTLTPPTNQQTGAGPVSMAIHGSVNNTGQFLYVSNNVSDSVSVYPLSTTTGSIGTQLVVTAPATPTGLAAH